MESDDDRQGTNENGVMSNIDFETSEDVRSSGDQFPKFHLHDNPEAVDVQNALMLEWVFGINKDIVGGVHNLSDEVRKDIFYVSGHIGVIYKIEMKQQILLQGHVHPITCSCVSTDKRWIVTADVGVKNMFVVWDSVKGIPVKTVFEPHSIGIQSVDISHDSMYISTLSRPDEYGQQTLSIWAWTSEDSSPIHSMIVPLSQQSSTQIHAQPQDMTEAAEISESVNQMLPQTWVKFHDSNSRILVTNGARIISFWSWEDDELVYYNPSVTARDFRQAVGEFTVTCFVPNTSLAATGTKEGEVILWQKLNEMSDAEYEKKSFKVVKIHPNSSINFVTCVKSYIVTGGDDGHVKFLDHQLRLEAWFEEFMAGPITSVSFNRIYVSDEDSLIDFDRSDAGSASASKQKTRNNQEEFTCPDFVVSTGLAFIIKAESKAFNDYRQKNLRGELVVLGQEGPIHALASHPKHPYLVISGASGHIHLWDYSIKRVIKITELPSLSVSTMTFDPKGEYLVVGCTNGVVKILDGEQIEELQHFRPSHAAMLDLKFSHDSLYIGFSDSDNAVGIFKWDNKDQNPSKEVEWIYVGRFKSHKKPISGLDFGVVPFGDIPRLMSVGEDRRLIEYDLENSSITEGVKLKAVHLVAQSSIPTSFLWARSHITERYTNESGEFDTLLFADNHYKITEFLTPDANRETRCLKTKTGPTFGGPLNRLLIVPPSTGTNEGGESKSVKYLAYTTHERVVGLIHAPVNGNQNKYMGLIAHSGEITSCAISSDGRFMFTAGGSDCTVNQWQINGEYLESASRTSTDISSFVEQIEGGSEGEFFQEIKHMFYYAQIRSQGEITTKERKITGVVALDQIPNLMRSIGFYASNWEIYNMVNELKMIVGETPNGSSETNEPRKAPLLNMDDIFIDFDTFIKIYVNHRPLFDIEAQDIEQSFITLGAEPNTGVIRRDQLLEKLNTLGERISDQEILQCLSTLQNEEVHISSISNRLTASGFAHWLGFEYGDAETTQVLESDSMNERNEQEDDNEDEYEDFDEENAAP